MKKNLRINLEDIYNMKGPKVSFAFIEGGCRKFDHASMTTYVDGHGSMSALQINTADVVGLGLLHKAIGELIDSLQRGVIYPLPEGDPSKVDAMKVLHEISRRWDELNKEDAE